MKKTILRLSLMSIALMLFGVNSALAGDGDVIFHETFDDCDGTGGNDGTWSNITGLTAYTHTGWTLTKVNKSDRCVELGTTSAAGSLKTSGIAFESGKTYTLIIRLGGWDNNKKFKVTVSTGKIDGTANNHKTYDYTSGAFAIYAITITETQANATLTIAANAKNSNRFFIDDVMIVEGSKVNVTIASSGWSSMATPVGLDFSEVSGLTAFVASSVDASGVTLTSVDEITGAQGVMLKGTAGTKYSIPIKTTAAFTGTNKLSAAYSATPAAANALYVLQSGELHLVNTAGTKVPAGKAYLLASEVPSGARDLPFIIDDDVTSIAEVKNETQTARGDFFDMQGRKVAQPTKGLYIVNGKKVIIK